MLRRHAKAIKPRALRSPEDKMGSSLFVMPQDIPMTLSISSLRDIRQACQLGPLEGGELARYWVDTDAARDPLRNVRQQLLELLVDQDDAKILFYGHGGSGKSTELNKLQQELPPEDYWVVAFSVHQEMNLVDVVSEDLVLVLMERLVAAADAAGLVIEPQALQRVYEYFHTVTIRRQEGDKQSGAVEVGVKAATPSLFRPLLDLFAAFKAEIRYEAHSETSRVATLRKRPGDLMLHANKLIQAIAKSLAPGQRLLFIVEDLDKLDIATARRVFIEKPNILTGLNAAVIYTIPIFTFHSPDAGVLHTQFQHCVSLPMIKTLEPDGNRAEGFEVVRHIILQRLGDDALSPEAMDLLIEKTGGVLQHAFEVIIDATLLRNAPLPLQAEQIRYSLQRKKSEFLTEITLPYEPIPGLENREQLYARLRECLQGQCHSKPCRPSGLTIDQVLLKSCALVEYNGQRWLGVHPLVQEILQEIG